LTPFSALMLLDGQQEGHHACNGALTLRMHTRIAAVVLTS